MPDLFTEEESDLLEEPGSVPAADIPNFEPTKLTLEEQPEPEPFSSEKLAEPVEAPGEISATQATTFAPPKAEPVYDISLAPTPAPTPITPYVEPLAIDKDKEFSDDWYTKAYTDDSFLAEQTNDPAFRDLERTSINPQGFRLRSLNRAWLERETGQSFESDVEYDAARNEWSLQHDVKPVRSDEEFAANRKTEYQRTVELQAASVDLIGRGVVQATADYAAGRPTQMQYLLDDLKKKYPALSDPEIETRATIALRSVASEVKKIIDPLRPQISEAMPLVERLAKDPTSTEDLIGLSRIVKSVGFEKGAQLLELVAAGYHAYDPEGQTKDQLFTAIENVRKSLVIENLGFATSGSITQQEDQIEDSMRLLAMGRGYLGDDGRIRFQRQEQLPGAPTPQGRPLTGEEVAVHLEKGKEALDLIRASRMVRDALTHKIDPIQPIFTGMAGDPERGVYTALSSTAFSIGGGLGPRGIGDAFFWWGTREMELNDLLVKNPGLSRNAAKEIAGWSATYQAPFNRLQAEVLFNRFVGVKGVIRDLAGGKVLTAAAKLGIDTGTEFINENFQNFGSNFTQRFGDLVASERRAASGVTMDEWKPLSQKAWKDTVSQMPDTFWGILPMMLIGAGVNLVTDPGITQEELLKGFSREGLLAQGLSEEQASRVIAKGDFESMAAQLVIEHPKRTAENMARANADGAAAQVQQQAEAERHINDEATPSWTQRTMPDGTIEYTIRDPEGNVVRTTTNRAVFEATLNEEFEMAASETLVRQEQQRESEETAAKAAESEATIAALPPEEQAQARMSPSAVLDFAPSEQPPAPEQQARVDALNAQFAKSGFPEGVRAVTPLPDQRTPAGRLAASFIQGFQQYTGRAVQFIGSESGEPLPYRGVVNPADPNTIFLDAAGDRAFLALLGHEWSHTLKGTNPKLYAAFIDAARPLVAEWQAEQARISERAGGKYKPEQLTDELVANIIGDAFAHPEFLKRLAQRNPGAFEGLVNFIKEWFAKFIDAATHSTWGTEALISDINAMHDLIIDMMEVARTEAAAGVGVAPTEEELAFARREVERGFYSKLEDVVDAKIPKSTTPQQAKATIASAGIKAEEIKWSGVNQAIDRIATENAGKVPKEKLEAHLQNESAVNFQEVTLQGKAVFQETGEQLGTRYETFVLPGGKNYREVVLSMPPSESEELRLAKEEMAAAKQAEKEAAATGVDITTRGDLTERTDKAYGRYEAARERNKAAQYTSSHFPDIPNYVAHMRLDDRADVEVKPGLFLEEIQSDRHQQGREKGYEGGYAVKNMRTQQIMQIFPTMEEADKFASKTHKETNIPLQVAFQKGIPDAPFRKDWPIAMFKRALRDAVATGKEWIGWTSGETQAERYDLSKQVDEIRASKRNSGDVYIVVRKGGESLFERDVPANELSNVVGKELAEKILAQDIGGMQHYSGLDLKVGGEGMKGFYDKILPNEVGKYIKQWGGKVEQGELDIGRRRHELRGRKAGGEWSSAGWVTSQEEAETQIEKLRKNYPNEEWEILKHPGQDIWKVEITPAMHKGVAEGQPLFSLREGKRAQARAEAPLEREASIEAIFERIHAAPAKRAELVKRAARAFADVRTRHLQQLAEFEAPAVPDEQAGLAELEAQETLALEDVDAEEQAALDQNTLNVADRYGERILAEQDLAKRRALERQQKLVEAAQRKGIEARFNERRQGIAREFTLRRQALRAQVEQATRAATAEGAAELRRLKQVQTYAELNAILKSLPPDIRGRIPATPSLADMSDEQLTDFLVKRITQISNVMEFVQKRSFIESINDLLARYKPKRVGGVLKTRIGDAQQAVNDVKKISAMDNDAVAAEQASIEAALSAVGADPLKESALLQRQNLLRLFGDMKNQTAAELEAAHEMLRTTIATGRAAWAVQEEARLNKQRTQSEEIVNRYQAETGVIASQEGVAAKKRKEGIISWAHGFIISHFNFSQFLKEVLPKVSFLKEWETRARRADGGAQDYTRAATERFTQMLITVTGSKTTYGNGDAIRKMQEATIPSKDGTMISQLQAIHYLMAWGQSDVQERMMRHGWTQVHMDAFTAATSDPVSQATMAFLRAEYDRTWNDLNPVYRRLYGTDMPKITGYAPTRYEHQGLEQDINVMGAPIATSGMTPSFVKARVPHDAQLTTEDAMEIYLQHMAGAANFIHYAELVREIRGTLNDSNVKMSLKQHIGRQQVDVINRWIDALARGGNNKAAETVIMQQMIKTVISGKAIGSLILNPRTIAMQVDSALRAMMAIPTRHLASMVMNPNFYANIPKVWHSDTIQRRVREGMSPESRYVMDRSGITASRLTTMARWGLWPLRIADGMFTSISSAAVFTYHYNELKAAGLSEDAATKGAADLMDEAVHRFSQPTGLTSKSMWEVSGGPTAKVFMLFMSDPRFKTAMLLESALGMYRGQNIAENARKFTSVLFMAAVSQTMVNFYRDWATDDDDDEIWTWGGYMKALALAPFQGFFMVGAVAESALAATYRRKDADANPGSANRSWKRAHRSSRIGKMRSNLMIRRSSSRNGMTS